jgi:hypothetical protein
MRWTDRLGWLIAGVLGVFAVATAADLARGGPLDPVGAPLSTMKTLDDVVPSWNRILSASGPDACNSQRFDCVFGDLAVYDRETGLTWARSKSGFSEWNLAWVGCFSASIGNRQGWRLPSQSELTSLVGGPMAGHPFTSLNAGDELWSATTTTDSAFIALVGGGIGIAGKEGNFWESLCVRGPGSDQVLFQAPVEQTPSVVPLCRWFSASRGDHFTTTACDTPPAPDYGGKVMVGVIVDPLLPDVPGTVPVYLWFSASRGDFFTTTHPSWDPTTGTAAHDGYDFVATLGRLYTSDAAGRCALESYYNAGPEDNLAQAESQAVPAGYGFSRTNGYMPGACP